jgi:hypothetical protein
MFEIDISSTEWSSVMRMLRNFAGASVCLALMLPLTCLPKKATETEAAVSQFHHHSR